MMQSLRKSNPYLRDAAKARRALIRSVATSTAIETGQDWRKVAKMLERKPE